MEEVKKLRKKYGKNELSAQETYIFVNEDLIPFAKSNGFNFSLNDYIEHQIKQEQGLLEDDELENISGGVMKKITKILNCCDSNVLSLFSGNLISSNNTLNENLLEKKKHKKNTNFKDDKK
jgi:hypothetical protein